MSVFTLWYKVLAKQRSRFTQIIQLLYLIVEIELVYLASKQVTHLYRPVFHLLSELCFFFSSMYIYMYCIFKTVNIYECNLYC